MDIVTQEHVEIERTRRDGGDIVGPGIGAGLLAGVAMALFACAASGAIGLGFWTPLRLIAGAAYGVDALVGGPEAPFAGFALHCLTASFFGVVFAGLITRRTPTSRAFWAGLVYAAIVWTFMSYLVLPLVNPTMSARVPLFAGSWFVAHLIYGAALCVAPSLRRAMPERVVRREVERETPV